MRGMHCHCLEECDMPFGSYTRRQGASKPSSSVACQHASRAWVKAIQVRCAHPPRSLSFCALCGPPASGYSPSTREAFLYAVQQLHIDVQAESAIMHSLSCVEYSVTQVHHAACGGCDLLDPRIPKRAPAVRCCPKTNTIALQVLKQNVCCL